MKNTVRIVTLMTTLYASSAFAASGVGGGKIGLIGWIFIGFFATVIVLQLIPSLILFGSMLASLFGKAVKHVRVTESGKSGNS